MRLTAPNPGVMTGPGTNSYLVGDPATGYLAIDPGPNEPEHLERLWRAAGGDIRMIVCTHSHPDHSPGARPLQALCTGKPPILGLPSAPTARAASEFTPDRALARWRSSWCSKAAGLRHTLKVIHTPGPRRQPPVPGACWKTACCSPATTSSTAAPRWSTRPTAT